MRLLRVVARVLVGCVGVWVLRVRDVPVPRVLRVVVAVPRVVVVARRGLRVAAAARRGLRVVVVLGGSGVGIARMLGLVGLGMSGSRTMTTRVARRC
ncbi:hypothetical protein [Nocardioides limicola]|uniref:hypothetical protein n=1 Tax=Nocardioides limicola TaxID=2803368 RepID=UPI00193AE48E|nr:hypothetical protein [Nocardioides sp. DJM-14]